MKKIARVVLVALLMAGGFFALPRSAGRGFVGDANAQIVPTPSIPDVLPTPKPQPSDPATPAPEDPGEEIPGSEDPDDDDPSDDKPGKGKGDKPGKGGNGGKGRGGQPGGNTFVGDETLIAGAFSTDRLVGAAARLRALGVPSEDVVAQVFPPFIIGGESAWTDTWGAPRYGPGPIVRTHEGQDVFCRYGDPILAPEDGLVSYSDGGLGGISARVHTSPSAYFYLTHLSGTNAAQHPSGSPVSAGDVVGFCGNSGNAATTPPHVHFGWYVNSEAVNPMRSLIRWLRTAERRVLGLVVQQQKRNVRTSDVRTIERLFGDAFAPDLSELNVSGESLLATGSSPATGAFALAETALQAAMAEALGGVPVGALATAEEPEGDFEARGDESEQLQELLEGSYPAPDEQSD